MSYLYFHCQRSVENVFPILGKIELVFELGNALKLSWLDWTLLAPLKLTGFIFAKYGLMVFEFVLGLIGWLIFNWCMSKFNFKERKLKLIILSYSYYKKKESKKNFGPEIFTLKHISNFASPGKMFRVAFLQFSHGNW